MMIYTIHKYQHRSDKLINTTNFTKFQEWS